MGVRGEVPSSNLKSLDLMLVFFFLKFPWISLCDVFNCFELEFTWFISLELNVHLLVCNRLHLPAVRERDPYARQ